MPKMPLDRTPEGWSDASEAYDKAVAPFTRRYAEDALRLAGVKSGERVLDVAAGTGALTFLAAEAGAHVTATDFAPRMIKRLRERATRRNVRHVTAEVMDGQALTLDANTFDAAFSIFGLIFFPDRERGFREIYRVLKPGGRAAVTSWSTPDRVRLSSVFTDAVREAVPDMPAPPLPPAMFSLQDPEQFRREMEAVGFRNVRIHTVTHTYEGTTPEALWDTLAPASPMFASLRDSLGQEKLDAARRVCIERLRAEFGDGPVRLTQEAHIGLGEK